VNEGSARAAGQAARRAAAANTTGGWTAVGEGLALGVLAAFAAALPAAARVPGLGAFIVLWASAALLVGPIAAGLRAARAEPKSLQSAALGAILAAPMLVVFGGVLKTSTHHRPLGAVTFAFIACVVLSAATVVAARGLSMSRTAASMRVRRAVQIMLVIGAGASSLVALLFALSAFGDQGTRILILDAALLVAAVALGALLKLPAALGRVVGRASVLGWLALIVLGIVFGRSTELAESVTSKAPLFGWLAGF
jgi:hypothetical protein